MPLAPFHRTHSTSQDDQLQSITQVDSMVYEALGKAHVPFGQDGEGVYSNATLGCFNVIAQASPLAQKALSQVVPGAVMEQQQAHWPPICG